MCKYESDLDPLEATLKNLNAELKKCEGHGCGDIKREYKESIDQLKKIKDKVTELTKRKLKCVTCNTDKIRKNRESVQSKSSEINKLKEKFKYDHPLAYRKYVTKKWTCPPSSLISKVKAKSGTLGGWFKKTFG